MEYYLTIFVKCIRLIIFLTICKAYILSQQKRTCANLKLSSLKPCHSALPELLIPHYGHCNNVLQRKYFHILTLPSIYYDERRHGIIESHDRGPTYYLLYVYAVDPLKPIVKKSLSLVFNILGDGLKQGDIGSGFIAFLLRFPDSARFVFLLFKQPYMFDSDIFIKNMDVYDIHKVLVYMQMCDHLVASFQFISFRAALVIKTSSINQTHLLPEYIDYPMERYHSGTPANKFSYLPLFLPYITRHPR